MRLSVRAVHHCTIRLRAFPISGRALRIVPTVPRPLDRKPNVRLLLQFGRRPRMDPKPATSEGRFMLHQGLITLAGKLPQGGVPIS